MNKLGTAPIKNRLSITSKEISSLSEMDSLFENYCSQNGIVLDFSKDAKYNAYLDSYTSNSFCWFIRAVFFVLNSNKEIYDKV